MSLMRLLAATKCLVGMRDHLSPYRVTRQRLLPKFGAAKNPFHSPDSSTAGVDRPARTEDREHPAQGPSGSGTVDSSAASALAPDPSRSPVSPSAPTGALGKFKQRFIGGRFGASSVKPAPQSFLPAERRPVQGELRLERVQVIRNDLSDSDLEVVPARPQPAVAAPKRPTPEAGRSALDPDPAGFAGTAEPKPVEPVAERASFGAWPKEIEESILKGVDATRP